MMRAHRVRQTYDHRLRDAIAATGNTDLFRDVSIPASTRRTWARGDVRPVVASVDVSFKVLPILGIAFFTDVDFAVEHLRSKLVGREGLYA